jgi:hypothetical protein
MWVVAADIGQSGDFATIVAAEDREPEIHLRHAERIPLGTSYPALVDRIGVVHDAVPRPADLVVDATGVGKPVYDLLGVAGRSPVGIVITGGRKARRGEDRLCRVPKAVLVQCVAAVLESGLLRISSGLPHAAILVSELQAFRASIGENGHARFEGAPGFHDDLVLAAAMAVWRVTGPLAGPYLRTGEATLGPRGSSLQM